MSEQHATPEVAPEVTPEVPLESPPESPNGDAPRVEPYTGCPAENTEAAEL